MIDRFRLKLKIFLFFLLALVVFQLKQIFFWCNKLGFDPSFFIILLLIGYLAIMVGYVTKKYWGYIAGIAVFSIILLEFYLRIIMRFSAFQLSGFAFFLNITINLPSILLTTFVHGTFLLYVISTRNYFKEQEPIEKPFHKVMFILLIIAFFGLLLIFYQGEQQSSIHCPQEYTFSGDEIFTTPENAIITDVEAYYNRDLKLFRETAYYSDELKRKLDIAWDGYDKFLKEQEEKVKSVRVLDKVDRIEITKKEVINEDEAYLEYTIYFKNLGKYGQTSPKKDFAYMINVDGRWKVNVEPEFEDQFKQMGIS